jgi:DNA-binding HxlR family transcriptional regulator
MKETSSNWQSHEAERMLGLIADPNRLRVISALALGATTTTDIRDMTSMDARAIEKALARLVAGELVVRETNGVVRLQTEELLSVARSIGEKRDREGAADSDLPGVVLARFMKRGRLTSIPGQLSKRTIVLDYLAQNFEPGRRYREKEVNEILARYHEDAAALRRYLVDEGFMEREAGIYWRSGGSFEI